ncbi:MAG: zinc ribbon domain-containing protein [Bryobacteraceae bacterium]|jgi:hypothetical protein
MPEFCTCGAQLPPDALFCHKCGKPQRELVAPEIHIPEHAEFAPPPAPVPVALEALPMNFRNPVAMRIAFTAAILGALLSWVPVLNVVLWLGAGYFAVFFYRRRTGHLLNLGAGLRMGWITGVMMFAIVAVLFTAFIVVFNASGGIEVLQSQFRNASDPKVQEALQTLRSGSGIAVFLMQLFLFITCLSMVGGALGAKLVGRASRPPGGGNIV